jgi:hypothetical protein
MENEEKRRRKIEEAFLSSRGPQNLADPYEWELAEYYCKGYLTIAEAIELLKERKTKKVVSFAAFWPRRRRMRTLGQENRY